MSDNYFPRKKYLFTPTATYDLKFKPISGSESEYATNFTLFELLNDETCRSQAIYNSLSAEDSGINFPSDFTTNNISINLLQHIPLVWMRGMGDAMDYSDMTSYEVIMGYSTPFMGDMTLDIYNVNTGDIEVIQLYQYYIDQSASGSFCDGIIANIDIPCVLTIPKLKQSETDLLFFEWSRLDASNVALDRTRVEITSDIDSRQDFRMTDAGRYLFLLTTNSEHGTSTVAKVNNGYTAINPIGQESVVRFTDRTQLTYYSQIEQPIEMFYSWYEEIDTSEKMDAINANHGLFCGFFLSSDEGSLYKRKIIQLINESLTPIDITTLIYDSSNIIVYSSNDSSFSTELWLTSNMAGHYIKIYSGSFLQGSSYDLQIRLVTSPCIDQDLVIINVDNYLP